MDGWVVRILWHFEHADSGYTMPEMLKFISKTNDVYKRN